MKDNAEAFEMSVPTVLQPRPTLFVSGGIDRRKDVPDATRQRLLNWCRESLEGTRIPLKQLYPEVAAAGTGLEASSLVQSVAEK